MEVRTHEHVVSVVRTQDWSCKQGGPREALDNIVSVVVARGILGG